LCFSIVFHLPWWEYSCKFHNFSKYKKKHYMRSCARQKNRQLPGSRAAWNRSAEGGRCGARPTLFWGKSQLEPSRDREDMTIDMVKPIRDIMQEDQWPTEWEDYQFTIYQCNKWFVTIHHCVTIFFSCRRINHLVLHYLHWSSVNTQAEYHVSNRYYLFLFFKYGTDHYILLFSSKTVINTKNKWKM
jgi:hypothetical protein